MRWRGGDPAVSAGPSSEFLADKRWTRGRPGWPSWAPTRRRRSELLSGTSVLELIPWLLVQVQPPCIFLLDALLLVQVRPPHIILLEAVLLVQV